MKILVRVKKKEMGLFVKIIVECFEQYEQLNSKKLDCYLLLELNSYRKDVDDTGCYYEPKEFCRRMFEIIAQNTSALSKFEHDKPEQEERERSLGALRINFQNISIWQIRYWRGMV